MPISKKNRKSVEARMNTGLQKKDAIGDAIVYMAQYCTAHGWSLAEIIYETWQKVKLRDRENYPEKILA